MERDAEKMYKLILTKIVQPILGKGSTYQNDLLKTGKDLLGNRFHGVYPCDKIPKLTKRQPYCILNLDNSNQPGSHWVACMKVGKKVWLYDSFARKGSKILPSLAKSGNGIVRDVDREDREQTIIEENCGARCIAWLCLCEKLGIKYGKLI